MVLFVCGGGCVLIGQRKQFVKLKKKRDVG